MIRIGINGFGRIGRNFFRTVLNDCDMEVVSINDLTDAKTLAHLLKYDSIHGRVDAEVGRGCGNCIEVNGKNINITTERDPANLSWKELGVDVVLESTGLFTKREGASKHIGSGASRVVISAPSPDPDLTVVMGVNHRDFDPAGHRIISNASCTTNCLAPVAKVLLDKVGIKRGLMTTIHSYTNDQKILDLPHKDLRRSRSAALSMIPTTTGAAKAVAIVLPELKGKMDGMAIRVPTPNVSLVDLVVETEKDTSKEEINQLLTEAAEGELNGIMAVCGEPLVSCDFNGSPLSSTVDLGSTYVVGSRMVKVLSWYDNETGYSTRLVDLIKYIS
ncbi:MAG: type I glyceraldehyde-3-phosphate dehydrogenase [bacterium]